MGKSEFLWEVPVRATLNAYQNKHLVSHSSCCSASSTESLCCCSSPQVDFWAKRLQIRLLWWLQTGQMLEAFCHGAWNWPGWEVLLSHFMSSRGLEHESPKPKICELCLTGTISHHFLQRPLAVDCHSRSCAAGSRRAFSSQEVWKGFHFVWMSDLNWLLRKVRFYMNWNTSCLDRTVLHRLYRDND